MRLRSDGGGGECMKEREVPGHTTRGGVPILFHVYWERHIVHSWLQIDDQNLWDSYRVTIIVLLPLPTLPTSVSLASITLLLCLCIIPPKIEDRNVYFVSRGRFNKSRYAHFESRLRGHLCRKSSVKEATNSSAIDKLPIGSSPRRLHNRRAKGDNTFFLSLLCLRAPFNCDPYPWRRS